MFALFRKHFHISLYVFWVISFSALHDNVQFPNGLDFFLRFGCFINWNRRLMT